MRCRNLFSHLQTDGLSASQQTTTTHMTYSTGQVKPWSRKEWLGRPTVECLWRQPGVSIISKSWVFYKGWYLRLEFFIRRVNLVFYKKGVVFYKKLPFLIKNRWFRDFLHFGRGKKSDFSKCEWFYVNVIDPIFLYYNVFSCYMHNLLRLSFKIEFFIKSA